MSIFTKQLMAFNISTNRVYSRAHLMICDESESTDVVRLSNSSFCAVHRSALNQSWMDLVRVSAQQSWHDDMCHETWNPIPRIQDLLRKP